MLNKMTLQGRITAKPEVKQTQSGVSVASFTVAWSEKVKEVETKCFQKCVAWRGTAEFLHKYFDKGQEMIVEGKMTTRDWNDDNGQKRSTNELVVDTVHFCGSKAKDSGGTPAAVQSQPVTAPHFEVLGDDEELPF